MQGTLTAGTTITVDHACRFGRITTKRPHLLHPGDTLRYDGRVWSVVGVDSKTGATVERLLNRASRRASGSSKRK